MPDPLFSCQWEGCAEETSYPADMLRLWNGAPICKDCYLENERGPGDPDWHDLPSFVPEFEEDNERLRADNARLMKALEAAPRPHEIRNDDVCPYMDWFFKVRIASLTRAREESGG